MTRKHWFWGGFILVLLTGAMLGLFALIRGGEQWASRQVAETALLPPAWKQVVRLTLEGGERAYLEPEVAAAIRRQSDYWLAHRQGRAETLLQAELDRAVDPAFDAALALIPAFADWYYSLGGEYLRLFHAVAGDLPAFLELRLNELVFGPAGTADTLDAALPILDARLAGQLRAATEDLRGMLLTLIDSLRLRAETDRLRVQGDWEPAAIGSAVTPHLEWSAGDAGRQGLAASAGAAASAVVFKKLGASTVANAAAGLAGKQSAGMLAALAAKLGLKTAAKSGALVGAGAGAAGGAGVCAASVVGAPLAPGCALVGGVLSGAATWVLVDSAVLEADELLHRDDLERQMREAIEQEREAVKRRLMGHYRALLEQGFSAMGEGVGASGNEQGTNVL